MTVRSGGATDDVSSTRTSFPFTYSNFPKNRGTLRKIAVVSWYPTAVSECITEYRKKWNTDFFVSTWSSILVNSLIVVCFSLSEKSETWPVHEMSIGIRAEKFKECPKKEFFRFLRRQYGHHFFPATFNSQTNQHTTFVINMRHSKQFYNFFSIFLYWTKFVVKI